MSVTLGQVAGKVAEMIDACDTDYRGDLFVLVAQELRRRGQFFTASAVSAASMYYGTSGERLEELHGRPH